VPFVGLLWAPICNCLQPWRLWKSLKRWVWRVVASFKPKIYSLLPLAARPPVRSFTFNNLAGY
jgi:hypothetical protein